MTLSQNQLLIVVLATVIPVIIISILAVLIFRRYRQRRSLFKRGITPINDEEIESWKLGREKSTVIEKTNHIPAHHQPNNSVDSVRKPPSVVIYHNNHVGMSEEVTSPRSLCHKHSIDMAPAQKLARAPNARPGLTDETVQGDDAFISPLKRQPSRLAKLPPTTPRHNRSRSSRSSTISHYWHGSSPDCQSTPRESGEYLPRAGRSLEVRRHNRLHSHSFSNPPRMSFDDEVLLAGLSPRPLIRKSDIGRAIG